MRRIIRIPIRRFVFIRLIRRIRVQNRLGCYSAPNFSRILSIAQVKTMNVSGYVERKHIHSKYAQL